MFVRLCGGARVTERRYSEVVSWASRFALAMRLQTAIGSFRAGDLGRSVEHEPRSRNVRKQSGFAY